MSYLHLAILHLAVVIPAFAIGTYLMVRRKGTRHHRQLGRLYLLFMLVTGVITLAMPAQVGPRLFGHWGYIHSLSVLTLITVPAAYVAARNHNVPTHRYNMLGLYFGGLIVAGTLAFLPGRMLHAWLFGT